MSITARYERLTTEEWYSLAELSLDAYNDHQESLRGSDRLMQLSGDWQAVHFLLTGQIAYISDSEARPLPSDPLESVVMGGVDTQFPSVYGCVRYLSPETVKECTAALNLITPAHYASRLVPSVFNELEIFPYSQPNHWDEDELEVLPDIIDSVRRFFQAASEENRRF